MQIRAIIAALVVLAAPATAETWRATYGITAAGVTVMEAEVTFTLGQPGTPYVIESRVRSRGLAALMWRGEQNSRSEGLIQAAAVRPQRHESSGNWRGSPRRTVMTYAADGTPRLVTLEPAQDMERTPVEESARRGTIDAMSAIVHLTHKVRQTARCDTEARSFDGRRLTHYAVTTDPIMPAGGQGLLRCLVESRTLAGFPVERPVEEATRPVQSLVVFGVPQPGAPPVPVRIEIASRWWGTIQATLTGFSPG